jgi:hypothetical protein
MTSDLWGRHWLSNGRPSQAVLEKDVMAILECLQNRSPDRDTNVILLGHSPRAGVAYYAAANKREDPWDRVEDLFYFRLGHA